MESRELAGGRARRIELTVRRRVAFTANSASEEERACLLSFFRAADCNEGTNDEENEHRCDENREQGRPEVQMGVRAVRFPKRSQFGCEVPTHMQPRETASVACQRPDVPKPCSPSHLPPKLVVWAHVGAPAYRGYDATEQQRRRCTESS
ncbi:hypothetical protein HPB50_005996 [Hyalomma asiaticum]|uniref:Uncharacterized protein n=1 Tax=Hyalomma asiaticum TaxID=266040 RepID=A0ACB7S540_HYAAI|nr:hypothetical protein HPB50_005996 [Hyalomma asiaticum]